MDKSREYIKMCDLAKEIQECHEWDDGDLFYDPVYTQNHIGLYCPDCHGQEYPFKADDKDHTWLPRQCQLHDMMDDYGVYFWSLCNHPEGWICFCNDIAEEQFYPREEKVIYDGDYSDSPEKALIRMVMTVKYNKTWTGAEWK